MTAYPIVEQMPPTAGTSPLHRSVRWQALAALMLVLVSFFMTWLVSDRVFEHLPHLEDEMAYLFQARTYARGQWVVETPAPRRAFWQPFVLDREVDGQWQRFGKYSPGWPALLATGVWLGQLWFVNAAFAMLTVALVYRLGAELFNRDVGLIAALLTTFSPMALLLNGTLMGHTAALLGVMLFIFACWCIERERQPILWAIIGGLAIGTVIANRPLTAVGAALPFVFWGGARLLDALRRQRALLLPRLGVLSIIAVIGIVLSLSIPIYNHAAVRDPGKNLYTLVWEYDTVGFGECCGRSRDHNLERAMRHTRFDLSMMAADLFGWQVDLRAGYPTPPLFDPALQNQLLNEGDYFPLTGLSWLMLPLGLIVAFRWRLIGVLLWLAVIGAWVAFPFVFDGGSLSRSATFSYLWLGVLLLLLALPVIPFVLTRQPVRITWMWLLIAVALGILAVQFAYWIGSQRYSTRYYFETLGALSILAALPLAWLARRWSRTAVYVALVLVTLYGLYAYSTPRISVLHGFNNISRDYLTQLEARRDGDRPVLVLVTGGDVRWRAYGTFMALTSPFLDSEIIAAWDYGDANARALILEGFGERQVIEMEAQESLAWFTDESGAGG